MSQVLSLLKEMRSRPGMYLGTPSVIRLAAFLRGYEHAIVGPSDYDPFLREFCDWIHEHFQTTQHSWEDTILLHSANEADAMKRFWELLDEYLKEQAVASSPTTSPAHSTPVKTSGLSNVAIDSGANR